MSRSARSEPRVRVALINEFPIFSEALGHAIAEESDLEYVGCAATADEAVSLVSTRPTDVAVIDIDVSSIGDSVVDGIDVARTLKAACPEVRMLILSARMELTTMVRAATEGA